MDQTLYIGDVYEEKGATVPDGWVLRISGTVDTSTAGVYEITYYAFNPETGQNVTRIKTVEVLEVPTQSANVTLVGEPVVSVSLADAATYLDAGATSTDGTVLVTNLDGTTSESFTGLPNVAGSYTLIYYVSGAISNFVTRTIHVAEGLNAPSSGPNNVNAEVNPPVEGPANLTAVNLTINPPVEGPTNLTAVNLTINPPVEGPTSVTAVLETVPVKPAIGYPIVSSSGTSLAVKPAVGYPIVGKPAVGYPIDSVQL